MSSIGSVSVWIQRLKGGEEQALAELHKRYWAYLVAQARLKLGSAPRMAADEEDVAQQAFWGFYSSLKAGRLPHLNNRHDLLALLTHITACQASNQIRNELRTARRGQGTVQDEASLEHGARSGGSRPLETFENDDLSPEEQAILKDCYERYVRSLPPELTVIAERYLAGWTHKQIAQEADCAERTIERKLALICARWRQLAGTDSGTADGPTPGETSV
jgi:RNA polymerase sigma factor (sigma-70 family)